MAHKRALLVLTVIAAALCTTSVAAADADAWRSRVVYQVVVDRWVLCSCGPRPAFCAVMLTTRAHTFTRTNRFDTAEGAAPPAPCTDLRHWCGGAFQFRWPEQASQRKPASNPILDSAQQAFSFSPPSRALFDPTPLSLSHTHTPVPPPPPLPPPPFFCPKGTLQGITRRLDYISDLGADAIWISPVVKQCDGVIWGSTGYHGYWSQGACACACVHVRACVRAFVCELVCV